MQSRDLQPRAQPAQARSRATVERLLDTALDLLETVGAEGFNTNLLAERAGMSVRAIYRYFPNKVAVLVALAERAADWERAWIGDLADAPADGDWRGALEGALQGYFQAASGRRGVVALRAAIHAIPELRAVEAAASVRLQGELAVGLRALGVRAPPERLAVASQAIIETAARLLDVALFSSPDRAADLMDELTRMLGAYLNDLIAGQT